MESVEGYAYELQVGYYRAQKLLCIGCAVGGRENFDSLGVAQEHLFETDYAAG